MATLDVLIIDIETYWTRDFSLAKMSTLEYITDPLFFIHAVGARRITCHTTSGQVLGTGVTQVTIADEDTLIPVMKDRWPVARSTLRVVYTQMLKDWLVSVGYTDADVVVAHNAAFDFPAIYHATGLIPKRMMCTMLLMMYRYGGPDMGGRYTKYAGSRNSLGHSFVSVVGNEPEQVFAGKDQTGLLSTKGRDPIDFTDEEKKNFVDYLVADVHKCVALVPVQTSRALARRDTPVPFHRTPGR